MTPRATLSRHTRRVLWSESAGFCQNPGCRLDLHSLSSRATVGELAHIIPASDGGPRGADQTDLDTAERADASNILVLCPTCHTMIDNAPAEYPAALLRTWKTNSAQIRAAAYGTPTFATRSEARESVSELLALNRRIFELYGPVDAQFDEDRADQWRRHVRDVMLPNNRKLVAICRANRALLTNAEQGVVADFELHARQFEERHTNGNWTPGSVRFPAEFANVFEGGEA